MEYEKEIDQMVRIQRKHMDSAKKRIEMLSATKYRWQLFSAQLTKREPKWMQQLETDLKLNQSHLEQEEKVILEKYFNESDIQKYFEYVNAIGLPIWGYIVEPGFIGTAINNINHLRSFPNSLIDDIEKVYEKREMKTRMWWDQNKQRML